MVRSGGRRQSRWLRTADGFAVCSSTNFAALVGLCILTWIKDADFDPVVGIVSCAFAKRRGGRLSGANHDETRRPLSPSVA
jgi:hypothetical protein